MNQIIGLIDLSQLHVFFKACEELSVFLCGFFSCFFDQAERLGWKHPVILSCVLETLLDYCVVSQEFNDSQWKIGPACLFVGFLGLLELIVRTQPVCVWKPDHMLHFRVLFSEHLCFVPFMKLYMQTHQSFEVTESQICLFCESVMSCLPKILCTKLNLLRVILLV